MRLVSLSRAPASLPLLQGAADGDTSEQEMQGPASPPGPLLLTRSCPLVHVHTGPCRAPLGARALLSPLPFPGLASLKVCAPPILLVVAHHHLTPLAASLSCSSEPVLRALGGQGGVSLIGCWAPASAPALRLAAVLLLLSPAIPRSSQASWFSDRTCLKVAGVQVLPAQEAEEGARAPVWRGRN